MSTVHNVVYKLGWRVGACDREYYDLLAYIKNPRSCMNLMRHISLNIEIGAVGASNCWLLVRVTCIRLISSNKVTIHISYYELTNPCMVVTVSTCNWKELLLQSFGIVYEVQKIKMTAFDFPIWYSDMKIFDAASWHHWDCEWTNC